MTNERERIGKMISEIRKEKNLTQTMLSEMSGLDQGHIARIEAGKYNVGIDTLGKIAEALDCTIELNPIVGEK